MAGNDSKKNGGDKGGNAGANTAPATGSGTAGASLTPSPSPTPGGEPSKTKVRKYLLTQLVRANDVPGTKPIHRIVVAASEPAAIRHVSKELIQCSVLDIDKAMELAAAGIKVEYAGKE